MRRVPPETEKRIVALYQGGMSTRKLAGEIGIDRSTVTDVLKRRGVSMRSLESVRGRIPRDLEDHLVELYRSGNSAYRVGVMTGRSTFLVMRVLRRQGVSLRSRARPPQKSAPPEIEHRILRLYDEGYSRIRTAQLVGVSEWVVRRVLAHHDTTMRPRSQSVLPSVVKRIVKLYKRGHRCKQIARMVTLNEETVARVLRRERIRVAPGGRYTPPSKLLQREMVRLYAEGFSMAHIARQLKVSQLSVRKLLLRRRISIRPSGTYKRTPEDLARIMMWGYQSGKSLNAVAREMNCSTYTVWSTLKRYGVRIRTQSEAQSGTTQHVVQEITRLTRQGLTGTEISRRLGASPYMVYQVQHRAREASEVSESE